jgi:hypothetical protein
VTESESDSESRDYVATSEGTLSLSLILSLATTWLHQRAHMILNLINSIMLLFIRQTTFFITGKYTERMISNLKFLSATFVFVDLSF